MHSRSCPRCAGRMARGFVIDATDSARKVSQWVEGEPEKSMWTGVKLKGRKLIDIETFRCERCHLLESYAPG